MSLGGVSSIAQDQTYCSTSDAIDTSVKTSKSVKQEPRVFKTEKLEVRSQRSYRFAKSP